MSSQPKVKIINHYPNRAKDASSNFEALVNKAYDQIESIVDKLEDDLLTEFGPEKARQAINNARVRLRRAI